MEILGATELRQMQNLSQQVAVVRPELLNSEAGVGELAWVWAKEVDTLAPFWRHRMWFVEGQMVAWAWVCLPYRIARDDGTFRQSKAANLTWQTHPDQRALLGEVLDWYADVASGVDRRLIAQSADVQAHPIVGAHGFTLDVEDADDDGDWMQLNTRDLVDIPAPELPEGFRFLTAHEVTPADAVTAHRAAWYPSRFTEAAFERVRQTWPYRADLHVFIAAPDGELVATAILWLDDVAKTAQFEPVGTHHQFRRQGLGKALQLYGMQQARATGAERMLVACHGAPAHPAALRLYTGVGFRELTRDVPYVCAAR